MKIAESLKKELEKAAKALPAKDKSLEGPEELYMEEDINIGLPDPENEATLELEQAKEYINSGKVPAGLTEKQYLSVYGDLVNSLLNEMDKPSGEKSQEELTSETESLLKGK